MKKIRSIILVATLVVTQSCGDKSSEKKENAIAMPTNDKPAFLDTSLLPKAIFNFTLASEKCRNIMTFAENYQRRFLPKVNLTIDGECYYSSNQGKIFRSVEFHENDKSVAAVQFSLDYTTAQDIDQKPTGALFVEWNDPTNAEFLGNLAATFAKWVSENALTGREACKIIQISDEDCTKKSQLPATSEVIQ